jgi:Trm5-related predicted tRNA methylase
LYSDSLDSVAYLSPDSTTYLESLDVDTTYVIGGLVDETVTKKVTINKCNQLKINTFALPIEKYMTRKVCFSIIYYQRKKIKLKFFFIGISKW